MNLVGIHAQLPKELDPRLAFFVIGSEVALQHDDLASWHRHDAAVREIFDLEEVGLFGCIVHSTSLRIPGKCAQSALMVETTDGLHISKNPVKSVGPGGRIEATTQRRQLISDRVKVLDASPMDETAGHID